MPAINPVEPEALDPRVRAAIEEAGAVGALGKDYTTAYMWAHRPDLALAQLPLHARYHDSNILTNGCWSWCGCQSRISTTAPPASSSRV